GRKRAERRTAASPRDTNTNDAGSGTAAPAPPSPFNPLLPCNAALCASGQPGVAVQLVETTLLSIVTAPFRAKARPHGICAPVFSVILVSARIFPSNVVVVPRVAELPTCQNTESLGLP